MKDGAQTLNRHGGKPLPYARGQPSQRRMGSRGNMFGQPDSMESPSQPRVKWWFGDELGLV